MPVSGVEGEAYPSRFLSFEIASTDRNFDFHTEVKVAEDGK